MITLSTDKRRWIESNLLSDTTKLRFKHHGDKEMEFAILQIECRRKTAKKLSDTLSNAEFTFPNSLSAEQCTSDLLAEFHSQLLTGKDLNVIDMTCGLGIDTFHMAREAKSVAAIDQNQEITEALRLNAKALGLDNITAINADCTSFINETDKHFDILFIDPARRDNAGRKTVALADCSPNVITLMPQMRSKASRIIIKLSPMLDISKAVADLGAVTAVYAIGTATECKELVLTIDDSASESPSVHAVTLLTDKTIDIAFSKNDNLQSPPTFAMPEPGMTLYEPYPAIMKAGALDCLANRYGTLKLHRNTHLYLSSGPNDEFPGTVFEIVEVCQFNKKGIKHVSGRYPVINVSTRNFRLTAPELSQKLKIKEGGDMQLFGSQCCDDEYYMIACRRIISQTSLR
ncbi:MAG: methyltransferase domain-containing protein [Muribaculaceae bacterium]|nr:methyltransferase domain-containing protein [Muribaculaceae bacterium]